MKNFCFQLKCIAFIQQEGNTQMHNLKQVIQTESEITKSVLAYKN